MFQNVFSLRTGGKSCRIFFFAVTWCFTNGTNGSAVFIIRVVFIRGVVFSFSEPKMHALNWTEI